MQDEIPSEAVESVLHAEAITDSYIQSVSENTASLDTDIPSDEIKLLIRKALLKAVNITSREKFNLLQKDLEYVEEFKREIIASVDKHFEYISYNINVRRKNYLELSQFNYKIVSLGTRCFSRTILTRWGVKLPKSMGEKTHPFDLSIHPYESICKIIKNDFKDYLNPDFLTVSKGGFPVNSRYKVAFNHEKGVFFTEDNFKSFIDRYERRIENFYTDIKEYPILFLIEAESILDPMPLLQTLKSKFPDTYFKLMVVNTTLSDIRSELEFNEDIIVKYIPIPHEDYVWNKPIFYSEKAGQEFEENFVDTVKTVINKYFSRD